MTPFCIGLCDVLQPLVGRCPWGKTLVKLGFEGESDFHVIGVG